MLVSRVWVSIADSSGFVLEHGPAVQGQGLWWQYLTVANAAGPLQVFVSAQDLPGHVTQVSLSIS